MDGACHRQNKLCLRKNIYRCADEQLRSRTDLKPVAQFLERFRAVLSRRRVFDLDAEVVGMSRIEQAVAFLALLELRRGEEVALEQAAPFAPIRVRRAAPASEERRPEWNVRSA